MKMKQDHTDDGFMIIEVVVALLIFTIGILALGGLHISAIKGNDTARHISEAATIATDLFETLIVLPYDHPHLAGSEPHVKTVDEYNLRWTVQNHAPAANTKTVNMVVTWTDRGTDRSIKMSYIIARMN